MNDNNYFSFGVASRSTALLFLAIFLFRSFSCSRFFSDYITFVMQRVFQFCRPRKEEKKRKEITSCSFPYIWFDWPGPLFIVIEAKKGQIDVRKMRRKKNNNKFTNTNENKSRLLFISFIFMIYFDCLLNDVLTPYCGDNTMQAIQNELKPKCSMLFYSFSFNKNRIESNHMK